MEDNISLADAIAPSSAPTPTPASAPAPAPEPASPTPPQPPAAENVNPYVPPAQPPQNLQTPAAPEPPAPDPGQPPQAPAQGDQPAQPPEGGTTNIPPEYLEAHEWRGRIGEEAQAFGGLDMVPQALKWSRLLFGLETPPDGMTTAANFMEELYRSDPQVYQEILTEAATTHADRLLPLLEDRLFAKNEIPKERLAEIKDFVKYGRVATTDAAQREFVGLLKPESQAIFSRLSEPTRNWLVSQVDRGEMALEFAEEMIREKGILLAIEERETQAKQREAEAATFETDRRARQVANETIGRYQNAFISAYAAKHGIAPEDVLEKVALVAGRLDTAGSADERHQAAVAWRDLLRAAESGNELRIKAAMSRLQIVFEQEFDSYMASRAGKAPAPANGHQPSSQPPRQPQQPQFEPDKPNKAEDWSNVNLDDYLFGRAAPAPR